MSDCREMFLKSVRNSLVSSNFTCEDIEKITKTIVSKLDDYELTAKSTAVVIRDSESEQLLKVYGNTLITEGKSPKTVAGYICILKKFMHEVDKPLKEVGVFDVRIWLAKQTVSKRSCENYRAYISAFYAWLLKEEIIDKNPMVKVNPIKYEETIRNAFSEAEVDALRGGCKTARERAVLEMLMSSGARVSELCAMDISDVNLDTMTIAIREGKGGKQRMVYINDVCKVHLSKYLESRTDDKPYLFVTRTGGRLKKGSTEAELRRIGERANVQNVHPHRCRRTFATSLSKRGMDINTIQRLMGHTNIATTSGYIALDEEQIRNEYRRFA